MADNFELLDVGQIETMHNQAHERLGAGEEDCDMLRMKHDKLAAELVKHGIAHDTEIICPESELGQKAPNYRRGFTDDTCANCAFGQLFPFCNLYKANYTEEYTCDSFQYFEILELEPPHGFLMASGKETAIARNSPLDCKKAYLIVSDSEVFGIATLEQPAQIKTKEFDSDDWQQQHRVTPRERRQWWPGSEMFYVYRLKDWHPYEGIKLYEDGKVIDEPKLTVEQWQIVGKARELPKQIILRNDAVSVSEKQEFVINLPEKCNELNNILSATYEAEVKEAKTANELIPIYSLALVRNPRMRVSKKNMPRAEKQEGEDMPFGIELRDDEYCVINTETEEEMGCHETRDEAEAQLTALRINVEAEEEENAVHSDKPRKRKPRKKTFDWSDEERPEKAKKAGLMESLRKVGKSIADFLNLAETEEKEVKLFVNEVGIGQKIVNGELWHFTYSTNAFRDREGEIFSTKALENFVASNEANEEKGFFNFWHINAEDGNFNTDFARKEWQGVVGRFLVEAGPYLKDKKGQIAKEFFKKFGDRHPEIAPEGWGCSPEFRYLPEERETSVYENIWITRTSTLPKFAAANVWTETRQMKAGNKMALSEQQMKAAVEMFGDDFVSAMIKEAEDKTSELETAGVAHKSNNPDTEPQQLNIDMNELAAEVGKQFSADLAPIAEAMVSMASGLKELEARLSKLEEAKQVKDKTEMPRIVYEWKRASEADETTVAEGDGLKDQKPTEAVANANDPWSQIFNK